MAGQLTNEDTASIERVAETLRAEIAAARAAGLGLSTAVIWDEWLDALVQLGQSAASAERASTAVETAA